MEREEKARVVASVWGAEFIEFLTLPSMILIGPVGPLEGCQVVVLTYVRVNLLMWLCEISCSSWYYILDVIVECWWCLLVLSPF